MVYMLLYYQNPQIKYIKYYSINYDLMSVSLLFVMLIYHRNSRKVTVYVTVELFLNTMCVDFHKSK